MVRQVQYAQPQEAIFDFQRATGVVEGMDVDKYLAGIQAVQTLSRLNAPTRKGTPPTS